jgi:GMP synthase (glutamine-hydrolysing)
MERELVLIRHVDDPPDDRLVSFAIDAGFKLVVKRPFKGEVLGVPGPEVAGTVIYGGNDELDDHLHPFLRKEARWIQACMDKEVPVLGICQGAQQIAQMLGAEIGPVPEGIREFGYYLIKPTAEGKDFLTTAHYMPQAHSYTFDIPEGAIHLAGSDLFPNQAFRYGAKTYGVQFHPELTISGFQRWQSRYEENYGKPGAQTKDEQDKLMLEHDAEQAEWFSAFLSKLFV